jgi:hypothetical protein
MSGDCQKRVCRAARCKTKMRKPPEPENKPENKNNKKQKFHGYFISFV